MTEAQKRAARKYDQENTRVFTIKLNRNTDGAIIDALESSGNIQQTIKKAVSDYTLINPALTEVKPCDDLSKYIYALRKCAKEHENDSYQTFSIRVSDLCQDTANLLERIKAR